ncbi:hypothetical protein Tco_0920384 [Tanacetum coccineum]
MLKCKMSENEDKYHDTVLDLKAKVKKSVETVLKAGNSMQRMFMLGSKPMLVYDSQLKHGLGYTNPYTVKKAISQNSKLYDASCLNDSKIHMNVRDTEDILEDATKNPSNESSPYSSSEKKPTNKSRPSANPILVDLNQMENDFQKLVELLETVSKWEIIFSLQKKYDIKEMKDVFESTESDSCETWKQNKLLKDQLLSYECVDKNMHDEIEKVQRDSIKIQDGMQKRINILENDVQRCQKQSLDFELQLQHEKEKRKYKSSLKSVCETSWISKMEKLESENVSLELRVQDLIKERDNVKT